MNEREPAHDRLKCGWLAPLKCMETEGVRPREDAEASRFQTCDSTSKKVNNVRSVNT